MHIIMSGKYANNCATQNIIIIIVEITIYTESAADKNSWLIKKILFLPFVLILFNFAFSFLQLQQQQY